MKNYNTMRIALVSAAIITGLTACMFSPFSATAQSPASVGVSITPGILSITHVPSGFTMTSVNIDSPITTYYSYYTNPETLDSSLVVVDNRFTGGFYLEVQVNTDYTSGGDTISRNLLGIRTNNSDINETLMPGTPATTAPSESATEYTAFGSPVVILNSAVDCGMGRVGSYTVYPSYRLQIPNATPAGNYATNITYTLTDDPSPAC